MWYNVSNEYTVYLLYFYGDVMIVTFCGHSMVTGKEKLSKKLSETIEELINGGADTFYLGGYGDFDILAAREVKRSAMKHANIVSILVLPYLDHKYNKELYDETVYPDLESIPKRFAILKRNRWMIDNADIVVSYVEHDYGGAAKTLEYAKKRGKRVINLV